MSCSEVQTYLSSGTQGTVQEEVVLEVMAWIHMEVIRIMVGNPHLCDSRVHAGVVRDGTIALKAAVLRFH